MIEFDIVLFNIRLRIVCDEYKKEIIMQLMQGHSYIQNPIGKPTYTLVSLDASTNNLDGIYIHMVDKWFDNASCDVWINNQSKEVYMCNIIASSTKWRNSLIQYFTCNLFNRLLEENGYYAFHSSCVEYNGKAFAFIAPRNSGKTNCMLNMMSIGCNSITNDKLAIGINNDVINAYGVAQDVSIRMSYEFRNQIQNQKYLPYAKKEGIILSNANQLEGNNVHINSVELAQINNVKQLPNSILSNVIFPKYDKNLRKASFRLLSENEITQLLLSQQLPLVHNSTIFFNEVKTRDNFSNIEEVINAIKLLDCYEVIQSHNTYDSFINGMCKILKK